MIFKKPELSNLEEIFSLYKNVVEEVNKTSVKLGWNTESYPDRVFMETAIKNGEMFCVFEEDKIIAAAVVNHNVIEEYKTVDWEIKSPIDKIATIHALTVSPAYRGKKTSSFFVEKISEYCKSNGDIAIHLDVIDTNIPAYKLYIRSDYKEIANIEMYYEVVGTRKFWMMEKVL